jgi:hypothetical protein
VKSWIRRLVDTFLTSVLLEFFTCKNLIYLMYGWLFGKLSCVFLELLRYMPYQLTCLPALMFVSLDYLTDRFLIWGRGEGLTNRLNSANLPERFTL